MTRSTLLALRNLLRHRRRSATTVFIAALGSAALLLAGGFALATYEALAQATARDSGHLILRPAGDVQGSAGMPALEDAAGVAARLRADPAVRQVLPRLEFGGLLSAPGGRSLGIAGLGLDPVAERAAKGTYLSLLDGALLQGGEPAPPRVLLGRGLAEGLQARTGQRLVLRTATAQGGADALEVQVQGVFTTGVPDVDARLLVLDVAQAQALLHTQRLSSLRVFLRDLGEAGAARERLAAALPWLSVRSWEQEAAFYASVRALYHRIFGVLGGVIGVIVVAVVASAMGTAVAERTREIGTLRALGMLPWQLLRGFALEGLLLGGTGALAGALVAGGLSALLRVAPVQMPPPPGHSVGYPLQVAFDAPMVAGTVLAMALLAALASAWVAQRTVRRPIVEALAHV